MRASVVLALGLHVAVAWAVLRPTHPPEPPGEPARVAVVFGAGAPLARQLPPASRAEDPGQDRTAPPAPPAPPPSPAASVRVRDPDAMFVGAREQAGNAQPAYPDESAADQESGDVVIRLAIAADGRVERATVLRSSGSPRLDRAAREGLAAWRFLPATRGGLPVPTTLDQRVLFSLE